MQNPQILIRPAGTEDVSVILQFIRELAEFERLLHEVRATEALLKETLFGQGARAEVLIAERSGIGPVGFALFFTSYSTFLARNGLYLEDLYVRPEHRGIGIGTRLLCELARIAVKRDCGRFEWSVLDWNEKAIALYRKLGAVPQSEWTVQRLTGADLERLAEKAETEVQNGF